MATITIDRIELFGYSLSYAHGSYVMSGGRVVDSLQSTVVRVTSAEGAEGFGEVCPLGDTYLPAFAEGARSALAKLIPALGGADSANLAELRRRMDSTLSGHGYAKSALEIACWDLLGRSTGRSLAELLGGALQSELPLYVAVPMAGPGEMVEFVARERERGIHRFQLKLGADPAQDAERALAILAASDDSDTVIADANGGWRRQDAITFARRLEHSQRLLLEQPCPSLEECLAVRHLTSLPMVLDEVITDLPELVRAAGLEALDHLNLKISRVGGLSRARLIRDAAVELGIRLTIEDSWGGDITTAAVSQLAAGVPAEALFAVSYMNDWTLEHLAHHQPRSRAGRGPVLTGPGLGIEVDTRPLGAPLLTWRR